MKRTITVAVLMLSLMMNSCSKKGDTGPAGPQGPAGTNGTNGNANVIGTNTITLTSANWTASGNAYYCDLTASDITQNVVDKGMVQVFTYVGSNTWAPLPYSPGLAGGPIFEFSFTVGALRLVFGNADGSALQYQPGDGSYRVVIITASQKQANPHTNWNNYDEVMKVVNESTATK